MKNKLKVYALVLYGLMPGIAVASNYTVPGNSYKGYDDDYIYYQTQYGDAYACGTYSRGLLDSYNTTYLTNGQTLYVLDDSQLLYCCEELGYWIDVGDTFQLPDINVSCPTQYNYVPLGAHRFCQATQKSTYNRCADYKGNTSGILDSADIGACEYTDGTCSTFTHCEKGYYKNGTVCAACPNGGTTAGYTNGGISNCYLPVGTTGSDATGNWQIVGGNCSY